jgi:Spy/CpxP family protein refolding chaperone
MARPGGGLLALLHVKAVQKDLDLTQEQIDKLKEVGKTAFRGLGQRRPPPGDLSEDQRKELRTKIEARAAETKKKIEAILTPKQMERLKEIRLQWIGPGALADPDVRKALNLTDEQKEKIKKLGKELREKVADLLKDVGKADPDERREKRAETRDKVQKLRQKTLDDVLALLTTEQRATFDKMLGKKLELKPSELPPPDDGPGFDLPARGPGR